MTEQAARSAVIHTPFIELDKLLKRENLAATGGEAGLLIAAGLVRVNGEIADQIGRASCRERV